MLRKFLLWGSVCVVLINGHESTGSESISKANPPLNKVHEFALPHAASRFEKLYRADALDAHQVVVAVRQNGMDELQSILMDISHPDSPNFGNFLTDAEIAAYTACEASGRLVVDYLTSRGATVHNVARNWEYITASWTIGGWEDALSTEFYAFDIEGSPRILRALEYSLPPELDGHVHAIFNTVQFPLISSTKPVKRSRGISREGNPHHLNDVSRAVQLSPTTATTATIRTASESVSLQAVSPGFVFVNGIEGEGDFKLQYSWDGVAYTTTALVAPNSNVVVASTPFASKYLYLRALDSTDVVVSQRTLLGSGGVGVVLLVDENQNTASSTKVLLAAPEGDPFGVVVWFINLKGLNSPYKYLYFIGTTTPVAVFDMSDPTQPSKYTWEGIYVTPTDSSALSGAKFYLCSAPTVSVSNCFTYTLPSLGSGVSLAAQQVQWVIATPTLSQSFVQYTSIGVTKLSTINTEYGVTSNAGYTGASQLVYAAIGQNYSPDDLTQFQNRNGIAVHGLSSVVNGHSSNTVCVNSPNDCGEANLDVQYLTAVCQYPSPTTFYYETSADFLVQWMVDMTAMALPPYVQSVSYGANDFYVSSSYANGFDTEAIKLCLKGVTIVVASGDDGAYSSSLRSYPSACSYAPSFPATSQFVTAVGATFGPESGYPEQSCDGSRGGIITSGGGFSYTRSRPAWQSSAVASYLNLYPATVHRSGRGIPDISLLGYNYEVVIGGGLNAVSGTSASAPAFAGMVSLVNAARLSAGKGPMGWLNPTLYALSSSFVQDITVGNNSCSAGPYPNCCAGGFAASTGWDPVTGLGSMNFPNFKTTLLNLGGNSQGVNTTGLTAQPSSGASLRFATSTVVLSVSCMLPALIIVFR